MNLVTDTFFEQKFNLQQYSTLLFYKGIFSYPIIVELSSHIRYDLHLDANINREKLFAIFVELAQNVGSYSQEQTLMQSNKKKAGIGLFSLIEDHQFLYLNTINAVQKERVNDVTDRIEQINLLDRSALRKLKMNFREEAIDTKKGSGNIGLVEVALKSANQIHFHKLENEKIYLAITAKITKQQHL
ncbi:MAG: SiaB family protein kinase [Thermonemataceae bacterium]|nr:SiaB family protein kinase [Thermonemataceae bacterium]